MQQWESLRVISCTLIRGARFLFSKRPEFPSGMTPGLRTTMSSWVMSGR